MNGACVQHSQLAACGQTRPPSFPDNNIIAFDAASDAFFAFICLAFLNVSVQRLADQQHLQL